MNYINNLIDRYPILKDVKADVYAAVSAVVDTYRAGGKVLLCGNGGSASDCEHVAGELLKGFMLRREPREDELSRLTEGLGDKAAMLQQGIAAIPLPSISGAVSAFANDVDPSLVFAQMVYALGRNTDLLIAFSTSGNSENVVSAVKCARALGIKTLTLTGASGGKLADASDICIRVPETETYKIQEYHLPVYHAICAETEEILFGRGE